jgi:hypothetical protein
MNNNKRFILIELFIFVLPIALSYLNVKYSSISIFAWGYDNTVLISSIAILISIVANLYIFFVNKKAYSVSKFWSVFSILLIILLALSLYIGISVSNFGF